MTVRPFQISIPQPVLDDLQERLARTRWPDETAGADWDDGTSLDYLRALTDHWQRRFDWRAQEAKLNEFAHFRSDIGGTGLHFIHERGRGPDPVPLLLSHGWPDSFYRFQRIIPMLTDPERYGGRAEESFDVVVPSLPGYGFSDRPTGGGVYRDQTADLFVRLMTEELGYTRFGAHGGDIGRAVTEALARRHPSALIGIHLTDFSVQPLLTVPGSSLSSAEQHYLDAVRGWQATEGGYALEQATRPQTLAYGLNDSPAGLAAWIVEKFRAWSDCDGQIERHFSKDELLTNIMLYWTTQTIGSSFLPYRQAPGPSAAPTARAEVPTGVALFPHDIVPPPRDFGERFFDIRRWTEMPRGGHFAALEEPDLLATELRAFFFSLNRS